MGLLVKRRVTLDLARRGTQATVPFSLGDRCAYEVIFALRDGSEQVALPPGTSAAVTVRNGAGGTGCVDGCVIDHVNNNVIYTPTVDALSVEGNIECTLHLFDGDGGVIGAPTFIFAVSEGDKADTEGEVSKALVANPGWGIIADTENKAKEAAEAAAAAGNFAGQASEEVAAAQAEATEARAEADRAHDEAELSKMWANGGITLDEPPSEINNSYYWAMMSATERISAETQVGLAAAEVNNARTEVQNAAAEVEKAKAEAQTAEAEAIKARMWAVGEKNTPGKTSPSDSNNAMYYSNKSRDYMNEAEKYTNMTLSLSVDREKHIYTVSLIRDGTVIGNPIEIDLPFEEVVVGGEYDDTSEELVLKLKDGGSVRIPVGDIISPDDVVRRQYSGSYDAVYTETSSGEVVLLPVKVYSGEGAENTLVKRGAAGEIRVRLDPEFDDEAVPKWHVDKVADAFGKALEDLEERVTQNQPAPVEIVQNLGDSSTAVIAQKGVTDAIDGLTLKGSARGKVIRVDDVAPGAYPVKVMVTGVDDPSSVKVTRYGATTSGSSQTYTPNADGTVDGVLSLYPVMTLVTDNTAAILDVEYNKNLGTVLGLVFANVAAMKADNTLKAGMTVTTNGYYAENDGGGATYIIRAKATEDAEDGGLIHFLTNGLTAEMILGDQIVVETFGAVGDGATDDTQKFINALAVGDVVCGTKGHRYFVKDLVIDSHKTLRQCDFINPNGGTTDTDCIILNGFAKIEKCIFTSYQKAIKKAQSGVTVWSIVRDCIFQYNMHGIYFDLVGSDSINQLIIENNYFVKQGRYDVTSDFSATYTEGEGHGVYISGNFCNVVIQNNVFEYNAFCGVALVNTSTSYVVAAKVTGNYFEGNKNSAVYLNISNPYTHLVLVDGNYFSVSATNVFLTKYINAQSVYSVYAIKDINPVTAKGAIVDPITHKPVMSAETMGSIYFQLEPINIAPQYLRVIYTAVLNSNITLNINGKTEKLVFENGTHEAIIPMSNSFYLSRLPSDGESITIHQFGE